MSVQELLQYFNIGVIVFVAFFALVGFIRGTYKSLFYLIATVIIFVGGYFFMGTAVNLIANLNLGSFNLSFFDIDFISVNQFVPAVLTNRMPGLADLITGETMARELVVSFTNLVIKLVYFIVLTVLAFTIFKIIVDILWFFFKPKKRKGQKRKKKTLLSRFGGAGIGTIKGAFYLLLICFPIAGLASIAQSIATVDNNANNENLQYNLVFINDSVTLVSENQSDSIVPSEFQEIFDYLGLYKKSYAGKIFGTVKADEFIFDSIFSLQFDNHNIKLRKELETVARAFSKSKNFFNGASFDINSLWKEDPEVLKEIVDELSKLEIIKVAIPVGIEAVLYLKDENGQPVVTLPENLNIDIDSIRNIDFAGDIKKLGYAFADITTIYSPDLKPEEINYLGFDPETVKSIFNNIGATDIVSTFAPIAISYITTQESVKKSLEQFGIAIEDLGLDEVEWSEEFTTFGNIYAAIADLKISRLDLEETLEFVTEEKVAALSDAMFESVIISKAAPVVIKAVSNQFLPDEYKDMLTFSPDMIDKNEFNALINAFVVIKKANLMIGLEALKDIDASLTNDLAKYLSKSKIVVSNLNNLVNTLLKQSEIFEGDITLETLEEEEWNETELSSLFNGFRLIMKQGFDNLVDIEDETAQELAGYIAHSKFITRNFDTIVDKALEQIDLGVEIEIGSFDKWEDADATEIELYSLFKSAKIIKTKGTDTQALLDLSIDDLNYLLKSQIISGTLVNVIKSYSEPGKELDFLVDVDDESINWYDKDFTQAEFTLDDKTITITPVEGATRYNIYGDDVLLASTRKLTYTFDLETIPDEIRVEAFKIGELRKMFSVIGSLTSSLTGDQGFSINVITNLTDEDIDGINESDILVLSIVNKLEKMAEEDPDFVVVIPQGPLTSTEKATKLAAWKNKVIDNVEYDGELSKTVNGLKLLLKESSLDNFNPADITKISNEDIDEILKSDVLSESIINQIYKQNDDANSPVIIPEGQGLGKDDSRDAWKNQYQIINGEMVKVSEGELSRLLQALKIVLDGQDFNNIDVNKILKKEVRTVVLRSKIVEATIINRIEIEADKTDSVIAIPKRLKNNKNLWYDDDSHGEGELQKLLNALDYIMDENSSITNFELDLGSIITNKDEILKSEVIVESIIHQIEKQEEISIPKGYGLLDENDRTAWANTYVLDENNNYTYDEEGKVIVQRRGEISNLLDAVDKIIVEDPETHKRTLEGISFDVDDAFNEDNQKAFLRSLVISETIVQKIYDESKKPDALIAIPKSSTYVNQIEIEDNRDKWFNIYDENDQIVSYGEISHLLKAAQLLLGSGTDFSNIEINLDNIFADDNLDTILRSTVISESIVQKLLNLSIDGDINLPTTEYLEKVANDNTDNGDRTHWYNTYKANGDIVRGEIANLLSAVNILIKEDPVTGKRTLDNLNFDVEDAFGEENQKILLKSLVISETIIHKIYDVANDSDSIIRIPKSSTYVNQINDDDKRDLWYNFYDENGEVESYGEIAHLLKAAEILLGGNANFNNIEIDLDKMFAGDNLDTILRSTIISETIVQKIYEQSINGDINLPTTEYLERVADDETDDGDRSRWYNTYYPNGDIVRGEIAHLLKAVNELIDEDPVTHKRTIDNINFDIGDAFDEEVQKKLLQSLIISETIIHKLYDEDTPDSLIKIPKSADYVNQIDTDDKRDLWYNFYDENDEVSSYGEIAHLLKAAKLLLGGDTDFSNIEIDLDNIFINDNQKEILKSKIISESIVQIIYDESINGEIHIPSTDYLEHVAHDISDNGKRNRWYNTYYPNGDYEKGEIAHLLDAVNLLIQPDPVTHKRTLDNITFKVDDAFDETNQKILLRSVIISETIVHKICEEEQPGSLIKIPKSSEYVNQIGIDDSRDLWFNVYDEDGEVKNYGEIAHLLNAVQLLLDEDMEFADLSFDLKKVFEEESQKEILKSKVISETIVHMIYEESGNGVLVMPSTNYLNGLSDLSRDKWFNQYDAHDNFVSSGEIAHLLNAANLVLPEGNDFAGINFDVDLLFNKTSQRTILQSYVFAETIISKILDNTNTIGSIPETDWEGRSLIDIDNRDAWYNKTVNGEVIENELAKLLDGISLIVGNATFNNMGEIVIDNILELQFNIEVNENKVVTTSDFTTILNSVVLEHIISPLVEIIAEGPLHGFLNEPSDGYHFYKKDHLTPYDTQSFLESLYYMKKSGLNYNDLSSSGNTLLNLSDEDIKILATAMVISRVFKGSIAKMFNLIIEPFTSMLGTNGNMYKFNQADYDGTPLDAYNNLYNKLNMIKDIINYL